LTVWFRLLEEVFFGVLVFVVGGVTTLLLTERLVVALSGPSFGLNVVGDLRLMLIEPPENRIWAISMTLPISYARSQIRMGKLLIIGTRLANL
jgi:hypothetical protein